VAGAVVLGLVIAGIGGYGADWSWTGFQDNGTLWDWLELFLLPVAIALLPLWLRLSRTRGLLRYYLFAASAVVFAVLLFGGYLLHWTWTGFRDRPVQPDDGGSPTTTVALWDWLTVALLPVTVALVPAWLKSRSTRRTSWRVACAATATALVVLVIGGYLLDWTWTGFSGNTLWDWLHMLLVPFLLPVSLAYVDFAWSGGPDVVDQHRQPESAADTVDSTQELSRPVVSTPLLSGADEGRLGRHTGGRRGQLDGTVAAPEAFHSPVFNSPSNSPRAARSGSTQAPTLPIAMPATARSGAFVAVTPTRIADSRTCLQMPAAVAAGQTVALQVTGRCGVPGSGVAAVVLTVTVVAPQCSGYITVSPAGVLRQPISDLTFPSGVTIAKTVTVPVGANGRIDLFNGSAGEVHLVVDLTGYTASVEQRGFSWSIRAVDAQLAARMTTSWQPGCPVPLSGLRLLTVTHRCFDGADHVGELVVAAAVAPDVVQIFHELYDHRFPIASLRLVDDFGGSGQSMAANNSSAFNCQPATGGTGFSETLLRHRDRSQPHPEPVCRRQRRAPRSGQSIPRENAGARSYPLR